MNTAAIVISIILPSTFAILILGVYCIHLINKHVSNKFNELENSVRSLIVDLNTNTIKFFNHNSLKMVRTMTIDQFCDQFSGKDNERFRNWINSFFKKNTKNVNDYLEIEVFMTRTRKKAFSVLKCTGVNLEKRLIHIDSYLFLHLSTRTKHGYKIDDISLDEAIHQLKYVPAFRGATINFKFSFINKNSTKDEINRLLFTQLKEIALYFAYPPNRYLLEISSSEFAILDLKSNDTNSVINFVHTVVSGLRKLLEINSVETNTIISVGIVSNKYFPHDAKKLLTVAQEMSNVAFEKNTVMVVYSADNGNESDKYASEIEHLIKEHNLRYSFSPIYEVYKEQVLGYLSYVIPVNAPSKSIDEIYNRSLNKEENTKLLTAIVRDIVKSFIYQNKDKNAVLFRDLKFQDCKTFISIVNRYKNLKIAPCFDEYDVSYYVSKNNDFLDIIAKLKANNIYPCLKLTDKNLVLNSKIYASFDYFIIYLDKDKFKRNNDTSSLGYRVIAERLLKYNKPIIMTRADGWSTVELLVRSGIEYIASPTIAQADSTLPLISSKNILKIRKMIE